MATLGLVALALALAFFTESSVEYFIGQPMAKSAKLQPYQWLLMYVAAVVGVGLSFYYRIDLLAMIPGANVVASPVGFVLSGLGIGRGSNWLHDFIFGRLLTQPMP
jgi:hypothetical protein